MFDSCVAHFMLFCVNRRLSKIKGDVACLQASGEHGHFCFVIEKQGRHHFPNPIWRETVRPTVGSCRPTVGFVVGIGPMWWYCELRGELRQYCLWFVAAFMCLSRFAFL